MGMSHGRYEQDASCQLNSGPCGGGEPCFTLDLAGNPIPALPTVHRLLLPDQRLEGSSASSRLRHQLPTDCLAAR